MCWTHYCQNEYHDTSNHMDPDFQLFRFNMTTPDGEKYSPVENCLID